MVLCECYTRLHKHIGMGSHDKVHVTLLIHIHDVGDINRTSQGKV